MGELLESLVGQQHRDFEVVIIDDGSEERCDGVVDRFRDKLDIHYYYKPNSGPGPSRNFGYQHARGEYFVVFDSDCLIPETYFVAVENALTRDALDAWGGPDRAMSGFTALQRAMGYTMSSFLTTGGIRGGRKSIERFQPRSFNMGISRSVFEATGGFQFDRFAEDIEFSIRIRKAGFRVGLIADAFVYHKRRTDFAAFYRQVSNFGKGRALVGARHNDAIRLAHWLPALFVFAVILLPVLYLFAPMLFTALGGMLVIYFLMIFFHAWSVNQNLVVALLSIPSAFIQLWGYGTGFLRQWLRGYTNPVGNAPFDR